MESKWTATSIRYFFIFLRMAFGLMFMYTGLLKVTHPIEFARIVANYKLIGDPYVVRVALFVAWLEVVLGLFLLLGVFKKGGVLLLNILLVFFIAAILSALLRGIDTTCGCFSLSPEKEKVSILRIVEDLLLLMFALLLFFREKKH